MAINKSYAITDSTRFDMAEKLDPKKLVDFRELLIANSIQVDALAQLLIEKGIITQEEFFEKLKQVQAEYQSRKSSDA